MESREYPHKPRLPETRDLHSNIRGGIRKLLHCETVMAVQGQPRLILAPIESPYAYATSYVINSNFVPSRPVSE